jgi:pyruvate formate lyase activating enzyme
MSKIYDLTPFTILDYPNKIAAIIWFSKCNMRCPYCYNPEIVFESEGKDLSENKVISFLRKRVGLLEGVVLCGGEPTLYKDLISFAKKIKDLGFLIKLDTNGSNPYVVNVLIKNHLIDYVALDFKAPFGKYFSITKFNDIDKIKDSLEILVNSDIDYEIRTTVHPDLIDENDINEIISYLEMINFKKTYFIQKFIFSKTIGNLKNPVRDIDKSKIKKTNKFKIGFRNF